MKDTRIRSFIKGISWRIIATATGAGITYFLTGSHELAASFIMFDVVLKLLFYYGHERAWGRVAWGRAVVPVKR
jgi:adenylylsulfate kinase